MDERDCLERLARGGRGAEQALGELHQRYAPRLRIRLYSQGLGSVSDDLVQEVFIKALRQVRKGFRPHSVAGWLHKLLGEVSIDHRRRQGREPRVVDLTDPDQEQDPLDSRFPGCNLEPAFIECVQEAFQCFCQDHPAPGEVLVRVVLEGWSHKELAEQRGQGHGAMREYVSYWRKRLREFLWRHCPQHFDAGNPAVQGDE